MEREVKERRFGIMSVDGGRRFEGEREKGGEELSSTPLAILQHQPVMHDTSLSVRRAAGSSRSAVSTTTTW